VKERHLLRRPKRKGATSPPKLSQKSSPESSMSGSEPPLVNPNHQQMLTDLIDGSHGDTPVSADLRESIGRYLSLGLYGQLPSHLLIEPHTERKSNSGGSGEDFPVDTRGTTSMGRGLSASLMNMFNIEDLVRRNLHNDSLLDLTKKS